MDSTPKDNDLLITIYKEICTSYHAIDDFRMKLLGLLPLFTVVGLLSVDYSDITNEKELISFVGIFAAFFAVSLLVYELRGIFRCNDLIIKGKALEEKMGLEGQFTVCEEENKNNKGIEKLFNAKFAACLIYMLVFAGWFYVFLLFGIFKGKILICALLALVIGITLGVIVYILVSKAIAS